MATVGVTADRRAEEQGLLLTRAGLDVVYGPAMSTVMATEEGPLRGVTEDTITRPPAYLIADTGIGIRSWMEAAAAWGLRDALRDVLASTRIAARGAKAVGALRLAGLDVWWRAPTEQLVTVIEHVCAEGVAGLRVALQLHGEDEPAAITALEAAGAEVMLVPVYRWAPPADAEGALHLIELACEGALDAVTFTSAPAVRNLAALARRAGRGDAFFAAVNDRVLVACIGPVCSEAARAEGFASPLHPDHWRLGALVTMVAAHVQCATNPPSASRT